jgi:hypothetical protein
MVVRVVAPKKKNQNEPGRENDELPKKKVSGGKKKTIDQIN